MLSGCLAQSTYVLLNQDNFQQQISKDNSIVAFVNDLRFVQIYNFKDLFNNFYSSQYEKFIDLYRELAEVSLKQGNKDLFFGVVDCKVSSELCNQNGVTKNLELKTFELRTKIDPVLTFINALIDEFLNEDIVIQKLDEPGNVCLFFKILKCKHCKQVLKDWNKIAEHFNGRTDVHVGTIDCKHHRDVCNRFDVDHYPRFYMIVNGKFYSRYSGDRSPEDLISFCEEQLKEVSKTS